MSDPIQQMIASDRDTAISWARAMQKRNFLVLDTETTGLQDAEIVQIAIVNKAGDALLDTLVRPSCPIPVRATAIHGITDEMVAKAPVWDDVYPLLQEWLMYQYVIIYNTGYDWPIIQSYDCYDFHDLPLLNDDYWPDDAMEHYAAFVGEWNMKYGNYKWQKLPAGDHTALGDCRAVLALIKRMAESKLAIEGG